MKNQPYPFLIPGIVEKIGRVLKKRALTPQISPAQFIEMTQSRKHRYSSVCRTKKGKKLIFYALLHNRPTEREKMKTEVKLAKVLAKVLAKNSENFLPRYFASGWEKNFGWLERQYFPQSPLEKGGKKIEKLKKKLTEKEILKIAKALYKLDNLDAANFPFLAKFDIKKYLKTPEELYRQKIFTGNEAEKLEIFLLKNKNLLEKENKYFCHGDFQIGNIILNGKVKITDLESANINNFAFDISFLTTRLWQNLTERKHLIRSYFSLLPHEKKEIFKILFRIDTVFIGYHTFMSKPREHSPVTLKKRSSFYRVLLKNCLKSFESLTTMNGGN